MERLDLGKVAPAVGLDALVDFRSKGEITGLGARPLDSLLGGGRLEASAIAFEGERARSLSGTVQADGHWVGIRDLSLQLCRRSRAAACQAGGPTISGNFAIAKRVRRGERAIKVNIETEQLPLTALAVLREALPIRGDASAPAVLAYRTIFGGSYLIVENIFWDGDLGPDGSSTPVRFIDPSHHMVIRFCRFSGWNEAGSGVVVSGDGNVDKITDTVIFQNLFEYNRGLPPDHTFAIINVGATQASINIVSRGASAFT